MSEQVPRWFHKSEAWRGWVQTGGMLLVAVLLFAAVDWRLKSSEALKNEVETTVISQIAPFDLRIRELEADRAQHDLRRIASEATLAEAESTKVLKPILVVKPVVQLAPDYKNVSEIRCELEFRNVGVVDASIRNVAVEVYRAIVTDEVSDVIERTQKIADCLEVLDRAPVGVEEKDLRDRTLKEFNELRKQCPHAQLFSVSEKSQDVTWEHIERLSESRAFDLTLRSGQAVLEQVTYVLTQSLQLHRSWFRLAIIVDLEDGSSQAFSFLIPTRRPPSHPIYEPCYAPTDDGGSTLYRWTPAAPLAPFKQGEE